MSRAGPRSRRRGLRRSAIWTGSGLSRQRQSSPGPGSTPPPLPCSRASRGWILSRFVEICTRPESHRALVDLAARQWGPRPLPEAVRRRPLRSGGDDQGLRFVGHPPHVPREPAVPVLVSCPPGRDRRRYDWPADPPADCPSRHPSPARGGLRRSALFSHDAAFDPAGDGLSSRRYRKVLDRRGRNGLRGPGQVRLPQHWRGRGDAFTPVRQRLHGASGHELVRPADLARAEWALNETVVEGTAGSLRLLTGGSLEWIDPTGSRERKPVILPPDDQVYYRRLRRNPAALSQRPDHRCRARDSGYRHPAHHGRRLDGLPLGRGGPLLDGLKDKHIRAVRPPNPLSRPGVLRLVITPGVR